MDATEAWLKESGVKPEEFTAMLARAQTLGEWLAENEVKMAEFARWLGKSASTVHRYVTAGAIPEPETMRAIYRLTGYRVRPDSFYDLPSVLNGAGE